MRQAVATVLSAVTVFASVAAAPALAADALTLTSSSADGRPTPVALDTAEVGGRGGTLALAVANESGVARRLTVRFLPASGGSGFVVSAARPRDAVSFPAGEIPRTIGAHAIEQITLHVRLADGDPLSTVAGELVLDATPVAKPTPSRPARGDPPTPPTRLLVPVRAAPTAPADIAPASDAVTIQTTQWIPGRVPEGGTTSIALTGNRARSVYADKRQLDGTAILRNGGGDQAVVSWSVQAPADAADTEVAIEVHGKPAPGRYTGTLPLSAAAGDPHVAVTVKARLAPLWPIVAVLGGAVLSLVFTIFGPLRRRKRLLRIELQGALDEYRTMRGGDGGRVASYSLDELIGPVRHPERTKAWLAIPRRKGLEGLFSSIHWARTSEDLDEDTDWALDFTGAVGRWEAVEPAARSLRRLLQAGDPGDCGHEAFRDTQTARDSRTLLIRAQLDPPQDDRTADDLGRRLAWQVDWHRDLADAWHAFTMLDRDTTQRETIEALQRRLDALTSAKPMARREADEQESLRDELDEFRGRLRRLGAPVTDAAQEDGSRIAIDPGVLGGHIVAPEAQSVATQAQTMVSGESSRRHRPQRREERQVRRLLISQSREDALLTIAIAAVTAAAYLPTIYDDTWGSLGDVATAIAAGFGARAIIQWALLPAFQSWRLRRRARQDGGGGGGGSTDGAGSGDATARALAALRDAAGTQA